MSATGEEHYNDFEANYFILFVLAIITFPTTFVFLKKRIFPPRDTAARCPCKACQQVQNLAKAERGKFPTAGTIFKAIVLVILWAAFFYVLVNSTKAQAPVTEFFDPYAILGLETGVPMEDIKSSYRKLSLIFHPDKATDPNDPEVQNRFITLQKAYKTLTDDAVRENWEKYGNPDGPQVRTVGIALPSWLVKKDNTFVVLGIYMALLIIGLPAIVGCWWRSWKKYDTSSNCMNGTMGLYYHNVDPTSRVKNIIELLSASQEYSSIPMRESDEKLDKFSKRIPESHAPKKAPKFTVKYAIKTMVLMYVQICRQQYELKKNQKEDLIFVLSKIGLLVNGITSILAHKTLFGPFLETLLFLQSLTQSCWKESPLLQLPHFNEYSESIASARKFNAHDIISFSNLSREKKLEFYEKVEFTPAQIQDIENAISFLPTKCAFEYTVGVEGEQPDQIVCRSIVTFNYKITRNPTDLVLENTIVARKCVIEPDTPTSVKKRNALDASRPKRFVHAPHYWGNQREECWWVVIGDLRTSGTTGGLVGFSRVGTLEGDMPVEGKIKFMAPQTEGTYTFVAHLICDGYLGFDKKSEFRLKVMKDELAEKERIAEEARLRARKAKEVQRKQLKVANNNNNEGDHDTASDDDLDDDDDSYDDDEDEAEDDDAAIKNN